MRTHFCLSSVVLAVAFAQAQTPTITTDGVVNTASYLPPCASNGGIAQGAMFALFGDNLGPSQLVQVSAFPLQTTLAGTSIRVSIAGSNLDALIIFTSARQLAAVLPSQTPVGDGTITVTYQGRTSAPAAIHVVKSAFGLFTLNQSGSGPAVAQNVLSSTSLPINGVLQSAQPGQQIILWGTGLGAVSGNEAAGPLPGDLSSLNVHVWVGDREARIIYRGRSGCCAGLDQIVFEVPSVVESCYVPIAVEVNGTYSNYGSVSISSTGIRCADSTNFATTDLTGKPNLAVGLFSLLSFDIGAVVPGLPSGQIDDAVGTFQKNVLPEEAVSVLSRYAATPDPPSGSCSISLYDTDTTSTPDPNQLASTPLDAGAQIQFSGPTGPYLLLPMEGTYSVQSSNRPTLSTGRYRLTNGAGGKDVGPFDLMLDLVVPKITTSVTSIPRTQDFTVAWTTGASNPSGNVYIAGSSRGACQRKVVSFTCVQRAADGRFTVPARILSQLPPSTSTQGSPNGTLGVGGAIPNTQRRFNASGLDLGIVLFSTLSALNVFYQ